MGSIQKRFRTGKDGEPGPVHYRAIYRDPGGRQHSRSFRREVDASSFLKRVEGDIVRGHYLDPAGPRMPVAKYAELWRAGRIGKDSSVELVDSHLRNWIVPFFARDRLGDVRASEMRAFVRHLEQQLAPSTVHTVYALARAMFRQAVDDRLIGSSPCVRIPLPKLPKSDVIPLTTDQVVALVEAADDVSRPMIVVAASTGLRAGEILGLTVDRVNLLRRDVRVDRQLWSPAKGQPHLVDVKGYAHRNVPLPRVAVDTLAAHLGRPVGADGLVFTNRRGEPWRRNRFSEVMRRVFDLADLPDATFHDLRHHYASLLIASGASVKVVQRRLGHASATETLDVYGHLWPDSEEDTRVAVDRMLGDRLVAHSLPMEGREGVKAQVRG